MFNLTAHELGLDELYYDRGLLLRETLDRRCVRLREHTGYGMVDVREEMDKWKEAWRGASLSNI